MITIPNTDVMTGFTFEHENLLHTVIGFCSGSVAFNTSDKMYTTVTDDDKLIWPVEWLNIRGNTWEPRIGKSELTVLDLIIRHFNKENS